MPESSDSGPQGFGRGDVLCPSGTLMLDRPMLFRLKSAALDA